MAAPTLADLRRTPNALAPAYSLFRVSERLLFTGHSHQAWPDVARAGVLRAFDDAAALVDEKWERAFAAAEAVRAGYRRLLDDGDGAIALGASTHELVVRFVSALPLRTRPRLVTSDGEFHTLRRQLGRLAEEGIEVVWVPLSPATTAVERLLTALAEAPDRTAALLVSSVAFGSGEIVPGLEALAPACTAAGAELLLDVYHQLNVVPFSVRAAKLDRAFITGGGYKYCQLGEGNAFLRFPADTTLRPVVTGWFAEFGALAGGANAGRVPYPSGAERFAGATYDPVSHYRAAAVFEFFAREGLAPAFLREVSQHQVGRLLSGIAALDLDPALISHEDGVPLGGRAGFLALRTPHAGAFVAGLRARGVAADARGDRLRLGPAPYLSDQQIDAAVAALAETAGALAARQNS
jgi:kynureninase